MRWPLSCGSSSCASTWLRATLLLPWTGWTQPSSVPHPSAALSALLLLWQLANRWVQEEPDIEGQNLSSNVIVVFETCFFFFTFQTRSKHIYHQALPMSKYNCTKSMLFLIHCLFLLPSVPDVCE